MLNNNINQDQTNESSLVLTGSFHETEYMSSLEIASVTGRKHFHVMRDIRKLLEQGVNQSNFGLVEYTDKKGEQRSCYNLTKKGCLILASGYDALLRERIIDRWEELEKQRLRTSPTPDVPNISTDTLLRVCQMQKGITDTLATITHEMNVLLQMQQETMKQLASLSHSFGKTKQLEAQPAAKPEPKQEETTEEWFRKERERLQLPDNWTITKAGPEDVPLFDEVEDSYIFATEDEVYASCCEGDMALAYAECLYPKPEIRIPKIKRRKADEPIRNGIYSKEYNVIVSTDGLIQIRDLRENLKAVYNVEITCSILYAWFRRRGFMSDKMGELNKPTKECVVNGLMFATRHSNRYTPFITPKGFEFFLPLILAEKERLSCMKMTYKGLALKEKGGIK